MCALNAKKTNAQCKALFDRLAEKGKNKTMYQDNFMAKSA